MGIFQHGDRIGEFDIDFRCMGGSYYESYFATGSNGESGFIKLIPLDGLQDRRLSIDRSLLLPDEPEISRFDRDGSLIEAEIASRLYHRNLCRLLGSGSLKKNGHRYFYIASELAPGRNLRSLISEGKRLSANDLMQLMGALLSAIESLHHSIRPIIHNTVCMEHIWVSDGDFSGMKLTGFSRAKFSDLAPDPKSWHGQDLCCVAPERIDGAASVQSDIFAAGALMYELVFGFTPWGPDIGWKYLRAKVLAVPVKERMSLFTRLLGEQLCSLSLRRKRPLPIPEHRLIGIGDGQLEAMKTALAPDPAKRFASSWEFLDALSADSGAGCSDERLSDGSKSGSKADGAAESRDEVEPEEASDDADSDGGYYDSWDDDDDPEDDGSQEETEHEEFPESRLGPVSTKGNGFADVAGMDDIKSMMRKKIINVLKNQKLAEKYRIQIPNGMLLYGPPGCGKSFIAEKYRIQIPNGMLLYGPPGCGKSFIAEKYRIQIPNGMLLYGPPGCGKSFIAEKYRIQIPNGMLLYGPPGCGKSFIAEKFAEEAGWNYKLIRSSDLSSTYVHGSQKKIGQLFEEARKNAPMILNFDEFDALVPDRGRSGSAYMSGEVNEFLSQMNSCGKDRVFVIASSNRPDLIDPAVRRKGRLDQLIYIPVPDAAAREGMFRVQMKGRPQEDGIDFGHLASLTENYVAADIAWIVNDAAEKAFEERADITEKMLEDAIGRTRPSVGPDDIRYYEGLREKIEKSAKESAHSPIGFIQK